MLSIIIPTKNRVHLLKLTVDSIIKQDLPINNLIISDNHSDIPINLIDVTDSKDLSIKIIYQKSSLPIIDHFNWCAKYIKEGYVILFADDDILSTNYISSLNQSLESNPAADVAIGNVAKISYSGKLHYHYNKQNKYKVQSTTGWSIDKKAIHYLNYGHKEEWAWAIFYGLYKAPALNQHQFSENLKDPGALFVCEIMLNHDIAYEPSSGTVYKRDGGESNTPSRLPLSSIISTPWQTLKSAWLISELILKTLREHKMITFKVLLAMPLFWSRNISKSFILVVWCTIRSVFPPAWLSNIRPKLRRLMGH